VNDGLGLFMFFFNFIFGFTLLYFILDLGKECDMTLFVIVTQVTRHDGGVVAYVTVTCHTIM